MLSLLFILGKELHLLILGMQRFTFPMINLKLLGEGFISVNFKLKNNNKKLRIHEKSLFSFCWKAINNKEKPFSWLISLV